MTIKTTLLKKLSQKFHRPSGTQFKLIGKDLCEECVIRHDELHNGREICFEDLKCSCYAYIFYNISVFASILPMLLKEFIRKNKFEIEDYVVYSFLEKMNNNELISVYTLEQKQIIIETFEYLESLYFMEDFYVWDYETETLMHHYNDEEFYHSIHAAKSFWKETIGENK